MHKIIVVVALSSLLFAAFHVLTLLGIGKSESPRPSRAASERFEPGDTAVVVADHVDLREGDNTVARLGKECRLTVQRVSGSWAGGTVQSGGKTLTGWVHERYLDLLERGSTRGMAVAVNSSATATETLDQQFARILAEEHDAKLVTAERAERTGDVAGAVGTGAVATEPLPSGPSFGMHVVVAHSPAELSDLQSLRLIERLIVTGAQFSNEALRQLEGLRILSLSIEGVNIGNAGLLPVSHVKNLRELRLWTPGINDAGLEFVARMDELEWLDLEGTSVRGAGVAHLQGSSRLSHLTLGPKTVDGELASLQVLSHLTELDLRSCYQLTEACLGAVAEVGTLRVVWLPSHLPATGDARIRQALPHCEVRR
ncbi:MAG: leucine-rich repeat domain-containing protein [Pirellulaceae bacterium]